MTTGLSSTVAGEKGWYCCAPSTVQQRPTLAAKPTPVQSQQSCPRLLTFGETTCSSCPQVPQVNTSASHLAPAPTVCLLLYSLVFVLGPSANEVNPNSTANSTESAKESVNRSFFRTVGEKLSRGHLARRDYLEKQFVELACKCKSVICCRVSPLQKAEVSGARSQGLALQPNGFVATNCRPPRVPLDTNPVPWKQLHCRSSSWCENTNMLSLSRLATEPTTSA